MFIRSWQNLSRGIQAQIQQVEPFFEQRVLDVQRTLAATGQARENYEKNLLLLNDVLADTEFAKRYWIFGGLLIGWAREGALLAWDFWDADFGYLDKDRTAFQDAGKRLMKQGFVFKQHWYNNAGLRTQSVFSKDGAKFEFWEMTPVQDHTEYFMYGMSDGVICEARCADPAYGTEPISFLNRSWQKPTGHDAVLTGVYGDWRVPNSKWDYMRDERNIVEKYPWHGHRSKRFDD